MDVVKLPKKFRMVCYEIMDGKEEALDMLESFANKYPHQVAAVKAEVAYFNMDYEKALALDLAILPWLVPLLGSLVLITYMPKLVLWLPNLVRN